MASHEARLGAFGHRRIGGALQQLLKGRVHLGLVIFFHVTPSSGFRTQLIQQPAPILGEAFPQGPLAPGQKGLNGFHGDVHHRGRRNIAHALEVNQGYRQFLPLGKAGDGLVNAGRYRPLFKLRRR